MEEAELRKRIGDIISDTHKNTPYYEGMNWGNVVYNKQIDSLIELYRENERVARIDEINIHKANHKLDNIVQFSEKERLITWSIMCWFNKPVTSILKNKLYPGNKSYKLAKQYDAEIEDRIIELGEWLQKRRITELSNTHKGSKA